MNARRLQRIFAITAVLLLVVVVGFYSYARHRLQSVVRELPTKLGVTVAQSTNGVSFTKSSGGKPQFTVSAGKAVQYKTGQKQAWTDVRIILYSQSGPDAGYDQIFGKQFDFDPASQEVTATGPVRIDLSAVGKPLDDPNAPIKEAMHMITSGLSFSQKTGIAQTKERIDFELPQGKGSAMGASYDSKSRALTLISDVNLTAHDLPVSKGKMSWNGAALHAANAVVTDQPREAIFSRVRIEQPKRVIEAANATLMLRDNNTIDRVLANGSLKLHSTGATPADVSAEQAELRFGIYSELLSVVLDQGVQFETKGASPMNGSATHADMDFGQKNEILRLRARGNVRIHQLPASGGRASANAQTMEIQSDAADFNFRAGNVLERAETNGNAQIVMTGAMASSGTAQPTRTTVTSGKFVALFSGKSALQSLTGSPSARVVSVTPGQPDRVTTSHDLKAEFDAGKTIRSLLQTGDFRYEEGARKAWAASGKYNATDESFLLTGSPRIEDGAAGVSATADTIVLNRRSGDAAANGSVKTTYKSSKDQSTAGPLMGDPNEPTHVTAASMKWNKAGDSAVYTGNVRMWQGSNQVQAPSLTLDRKSHTLQAISGSATSAVQTAMVQTAKDGKQSPVNITSATLKYSDADRQAHFEGGVTLHSAAANMSAQRIDVQLRAKETSQSTPVKSGQLQSITASGMVHMDQAAPIRKATGEKLIYTSDEEKYELTGAPGAPPSIFDAEKGNVTGDSLTFYSHDDRVQINGGQNGRVVTRTTVKDGKKP